MRVEAFVSILDSGFYTGVPDSQLKALCAYLTDTWGVDGRRHLIAANEGNSVALAAGYYLATGKTPVVYLQNSGEGNAVNPLASLCAREVYGIPLVLVIGWRGEPGVRDEPQHILQGRITLGLLDTMGIPYFILSPDTAPEEAAAAMAGFRDVLAGGGQAAFVVRKGALDYEGGGRTSNPWSMTREEVIRRVTAAAGEDPLVSTTGKASRELYELRDAAGQGHGRDFLTVGSMGHSSSIALGLALHRPDRRFWILDGDGAALMHLGAMAVIGAYRSDNLIHVMLNNAAHESVGGQPTVAGGMDLPAIARGCGYPFAARAETRGELDALLARAKGLRELCFIEARCALGSRPDLGRPDTGPRENRDAFMNTLGVMP